eukprot:TRINITY_DN50647_c0_g3_i1.p1 TRINITY_DN50647_c0_g3~~TRINITY_DN50647_c0_g3_i1.p1  ORF type:complete len:259 (-),score=36.81 TRINITY_DN50647_c0_g3_i1:268-954(-)
MHGVVFYVPFGVLQDPGLQFDKDRLTQQFRKAQAWNPIVVIGRIDETEESSYDELKNLASELFGIPKYRVFLNSNVDDSETNKRKLYTIVDTLITNARGRESSVAHIRDEGFQISAKGIECHFEDDDDDDHGNSRVWRSTLNPGCGTRGGRTGGGYSGGFQPGGLFGFANIQQLFSSSFGNISRTPPPATAPSAPSAPSAPGQFCPQCGNRCGTGARFCSGCGTALGA